jgi:hypothetical protein
VGKNPPGEIDFINNGVGSQEDTTASEKLAQRTKRRERKSLTQEEKRKASCRRKGTRGGDSNSA